MVQAFDILRSSIALHQPRLMTEIANWHPHIPFAFFLVALQRPRTIVELGTHRGDSYCAFCQAVDELGIDASCTAVDHWKGDDQALPYGEEVLEELRHYHDPLYGRFSRLLRSSFDDAAVTFDEGSIDLLHIDGHHSYESVRHDFETWLPKMSPSGIVLFHDTQVREGTFGVWKLWEEIRGSFPSTEFSFGHGLGVLAVGAKIDEPVLSFFSQFENSSGQLEELFCRLGMACSLSASTARLETRLRQKEADVQRRTEELIAQTGELQRVVDGEKARREQAEAARAELSLAADALRRRTEELIAQTGELQRAVDGEKARREQAETSRAELSLAADALRRRTEELIAQTGELQRAVDGEKARREQAEAACAATALKLEGAERQLARQATQLDKMTRQLTLTSETAARLEQAIAEYERTVAALLASRSWRITAPLRACMDAISRRSRGRDT